MAVKLRFTRTGRVNIPTYRLVAIDEHKKRDGKFIEILGTYSPLSKTDNFQYKKERVDYWLSCGAQPSATVASLLKKSNHSKTPNSSAKKPVSI